MTRFKMPDDATFGVRLAVISALHGEFRMRAWGAGKQGWFSATCRTGFWGPEVLIPRQRLRKGEWRSILHHIDQGLWILAECPPPAETWLILDGSLITLELQDRERSRRIERDTLAEPALARTINFLLRASTVFDHLPAGHLDGYAISSDCHLPFRFEDPLFDPD